VIKHFDEPPGKASKIAEQLAGVAPQGERAACNCNPPAEPEDVEPFIKFYRAAYPGLDLPTSAEALESKWHKYCEHKAAQQRTSTFTPQLDYEPAVPNPNDFIRLPSSRPGYAGVPA
jgi:hypothetical protein